MPSVTKELAAGRCNFYYTLDYTSGRTQAKLDSVFPERRKMFT